jgi:hypothetical protein
MRHNSSHIEAVEMSTLEVKIPDLLLKQVNEVAAKENVSVDQIVSIALAAQVSASHARESITSRGKRVDWRKVDDILARVPSQPTAPGRRSPVIEGSVPSGVKDWMKRGPDP